MGEQGEVFRLTPRGPEGTLGLPSRLAWVGGQLDGELHGDEVLVRLKRDSDGTVLMLPGEYRARLDPLELLDENGDLIAREGEWVGATGGFLPPGDPRVVACGPVFSTKRLAKDERLRQ